MLRSFHTLSRCERGKTRSRLLSWRAFSARCALTLFVALGLAAALPTRAQYADPRLSNVEVGRWFKPGLRRGDGQPCRVWGGNQVNELIDGPQTFWTMVQDIRGAGGPRSYIYLIGWWLTDSFNLVPGDNTSTIRSLFQAASNRDVEIRAMLWKQKSFSGYFGFPGQNAAEVDRINALPTGGAILDNRTLNFGSHHQKILIINGCYGLTAFCGGIDINPDRLHANGNFGVTQAGAPMHDVHCRIKGPAAWDLLNIFVERWYDHPDRLNLPAGKQGLIGVRFPPAPPAPLPGQTNFVQIGRTYGNGTAHLGIPGAASYGGYRFAPRGEQTARQMILHAIRKARKFIYVEDQYLVNPEVRDALIAALHHVAHITILIPEDRISDLPQVHYRRWQFINPLRKAGGGKVRVFYLTAPGDFHTYVHAKTWIFDDEYAIIGSANCNRRSYTHDSEVVAGICDQGTGDKWRLPHRLRIKLWSEHLGVAPLAVVDGVLSAPLWLAPPPGARVAPYDEWTPFPVPPLPLVDQELFWRNVVDPDGS